MNMNLNRRSLLTGMGARIMTPAQVREKLKLKQQVIAA